MARPAQPLPASDSAIIPLYRPDLSGNERKYVNECLDTGWISGQGSFVERFERAVVEYTGAEHAVAVSNGTVGLHLALHCLGVGPGDEVIVPSFTFVAPVNMIALTGATPVFADCRPSDWLLDPDDVEQRITSRTKAILPVHLYRAACDMTAFVALAAKYKLLLIEDAAQGVGMRLHDQHVGTFGDVGVFSFFGSKTLTTGEGGMVVTRDADYAELLRRARNQGVMPGRIYWHDCLGFNYRMSNLSAAIGLAQIERLEATLFRKRQLAMRYKRALADLPVTLQEPIFGTASSEWLMTCLLPEGTDRELVRAKMRQDGIETRPTFGCVHKMPMYAAQERLPTAESVSARGVSLPSYPGLTDDDVDRVTSSLRGAIEAAT
ncbi:MAG: DegT/DnrJ/EryC1/StrS aminotransferase family protein [Bryobacteraceae bacterium]|nr:DegT/DnrJ/EryC1/StrS aminotransferase family protein [Bryobacteraceae bacterium]